jgi:hypothetical protein
LVWTASADAAEQRCGALGANCVCSEQFQMAGFTSLSGAWLNPTDSTTKECGIEVANYPITRTLSGVSINTDATALARLPAGNTVQRFLSGATGSSGMFFVGADLTSESLGATYNARMAIRGYVYHSPDYNFRDETPPCHSKFLQGNPGSWHIENANGDLAMYQFLLGTNWGPSSAFPRDCCWGTPGAQATLNKNDWKGHWFRVEEVVTNRTGPGLRHQLYMKDVTRGVTQFNGGNEFIASDWYGTTGGPDPWTADFNKNITSSPPSLPMAFNFYREVSAGGGQCNGWRGITHMIVAGWATDTGQRIGAAVEVEGSGLPSDLVPPSMPKNLRLL